MEDGADASNAAADCVACDAYEWTGRLAPSPTGRLHIGNAYAALAAWLSARSRGGRLVLRIEDIDRQRCKPGADTAVMEDLRWLGLDWDGDVIWQSARGDLYDLALAALQRKGLIYPCFCSRGQLRAASAPHDDDGFLIYPGTCRRMSDTERRRRLEDGERHSWRLAMPDSQVTVHDRIFGDRVYDLAKDCGDVVLRRSDGMVAYQLAVTVDDMAQCVTDIVRGRDLLRSAAIQLWLRRCLADGDVSSVMPSAMPFPVPHADSVLASPTAPTPCAPSFAHLPLLDDASGKRLAKRDRAVDLASLRARGVRPQSVVGYCAWLMGIVESPEPAEPGELLAAYSEATISKDLSDRHVDTDDMDGTGRADIAADDRTVG